MTKNNKNVKTTLMDAVAKTVVQTRGAKSTGVKVGTVKRTVLTIPIASFSS